MKRQRGFALIVVLGLSTALAIMAAVLLRSFALEFTHMSYAEAHAVSMQRAEAGLEKAIYEYLHDQSYRGEEGISFADGTATVRVQLRDGNREVLTIVSEGTYSCHAATCSVTLEGTYRISLNEDGRLEVETKAIRLVSTGSPRKSADD